MFCEHSQPVVALKKPKTFSWQHEYAGDILILLLLHFDMCLLVSATFVRAGSVADPLDYHWEANTASWLSNHSLDPYHSYQRRPCRTDGEPIVAVCALYINST